jgi:hypothetical protein
MTTADELRKIVEYLQARVRLTAAGGRDISFDVPDAATMSADGLDEPTVRGILASPWWSEMVEEVLETPDFAEPDEPPEVILGYARDVVAEYVRKRYAPTD